jgi:putative tryptophan/tyrosine transport system substrate-binding protein
MVARAQQLPIVGVLSPLFTAAAARNIEAFRRGMRELGYAERRSVALKFRYADGHIDRLPDLAADLVTLKPAVIVAGSPAAATAARNATGTGSAYECDTSCQRWLSKGGINGL